MSLSLQKLTVFAQNFKFIYLAQLIAVLNSYPHTMSPVPRLKWSAFLGRGFKTMTNTLASVPSAWNFTLDKNDVPSA